MPQNMLPMYGIGSGNSHQLCMKCPQGGVTRGSTPRSMNPTPNMRAAVRLIMLMSVLISVSVGLKAPLPRQGGDLRERRGTGLPHVVDYLFAFRRRRCRCRKL